MVGLRVGTWVPIEPGWEGAASAAEMGIQSDAELLIGKILSHSGVGDRVVGRPLGAVLVTGDICLVVSHASAATRVILECTGVKLFGLRWKGSGGGDGACVSFRVCARWGGVLATVLASHRLGRRS